jgi:hypothetical protein
MTKGRRMLKIIDELREERAYIKSLPALTRAEMKKWNDPFGKSRSVDVDAIVEAKVDEQARFVIVRYSDGKAWAGPWLNNGTLFSSVESKWYVFKSEADAWQAIERENFKFRTEIFEL